ncbi:MAG: phosphoglucosamine mutase [Coxiella sp. (in: Bacteria)]|nr:MAG: phosphoglucosamine mutase [Coxiella sp. (in: g-proteobacteria)]
MTRNYFGTDGIRGRVGGALINTEFMLTLGWAIGTVLTDEQHKTVLIGRDTRVSGTVLESALEAGLASAGAVVRTLGIIPTPAVAYLTQSMRAQAGIVISASHNPYHDNGVKIFNQQGMKISDEQELAIEALLTEPLTMVSSEQMSAMSRLMYDAQGRYIEFCKGTFPDQLTLEGLKIVIDAANGAGHKVAPTIFKELGATIVTLGCSPDGFNINEQCGAMSTKTLRARVRAEQADIGIALDGDGDRLLLVDHKGELVDGDEILAILANENVSGVRAGVVGTLMSNLGLEQAMAGLGIEFERARVGDRYVLERLLEKGWTLGGEASGHIIDLDYTTTGDGIISALQVLRVMQRHKVALSELKQVMQKRPQILENIRFSGDIDIINHPETQAIVTQVSERLVGRGRVLLRLSGTEPLVRVMVEGDDENEVRAAVDEISAVIYSLITNRVEIMN